MILGDARLYFADQIRAHISSLRINAAAHTRKERN